MAHLSLWQYGLLIFVARFSHAMVLLSQAKEVKKGPDAWVSALIAMACGTGILWLLATWAARRPQQSAIQRARRAMGPVLGGVVGWLLALSILISAILTVRLYADLLTAQPMPETPIEVFLAMLVVGACYAAWHGPEVIARVGEITTPLVVLGVVSVLLLATREMNPLNLKPVLGWGWWPAIRASLVATTMNVDLLVVLMMPPLLARPERMARATALASVSADLLVIICYVSLLMFYGSEEARRIAFPLYDMARTISIGDFLERLDPLFIVIWTAGSFVRLSLLLWGVCEALRQLTGLREYRPLAAPLGYLAIFCALRLYDNFSQAVTLNSATILPWTAGPILLGLPALLAAAEWIRAGRGG